MDGRTDGRTDEGVDGRRRRLQDNEVSVWNPQDFSCFLFLSFRNASRWTKTTSGWDEDFVGL